jgi:hypothetical protein
LHRAFVRVAPGGAVDTSIDLAERTGFACTLGGADRRTLFMLEARDDNLHHAAARQRTDPARCASTCRASACREPTRALTSPRTERASKLDEVRRYSGAPSATPTGAARGLVLLVDEAVDRSLEPLPRQLGQIVALLSAARRVRLLPSD